MWFFNKNKEQRKSEAGRQYFFAWKVLYVYESLVRHNEQHKRVHKWKSVRQIVGEMEAVPYEIEIIHIKA